MRATVIFSISTILAFVLVSACTPQPKLSPDIEPQANSLPGNMVDGPSSCEAISEEQSYSYSPSKTHIVLEILDRPAFFNARPKGKGISFEEYERIKAEFVNRNPRWEPKYALTYREEQGNSYSLELESFNEDTAWLAHLTQGRGKGWDWVARYELARSHELDEEFRIPQILEQRSRIIGGVKYGMAVAEVIARKGEPTRIMDHAEEGSAHLIYEDVKVSVRQWYPRSGRGRVVGVTSVAKRENQDYKKSTSPQPK